MGEQKKWDTSSFAQPWQRGARDAGLNCLLRRQEKAATAREVEDVHRGVQGLLDTRRAGSEAAKCFGF